MTKRPRPKGFNDPLYMPPDEILRALGRVAAVSAGIEDSLHALYWKMLGADDEAGKVVTGDMRASRMTEDILKLARAIKHPTESIDDLADLFADFREKNQRRNQVLHWIWDTQGVEAPGYKAKQRLSYTAAEVNDLADDLIWIETRLASHLLSSSSLQKEREKLGTDADLYAPLPLLKRG
ncbi:hypothetical protein BKD09_24005 [Bradyrhizobium japonicum]|uniref:Uncharacterized protein n=1 Tax=Bradyrhizobium japonicum TaxID=375 RepID=A0A1L3FDS8_BRAJP|nr:hypothetical protein [Bradyrhizobium japonicum]APG11402.1 hypothetical protein BKD09_24005 [Bradyrhizobium japonicum]